MLNTDFFDRDAQRVACDLLGKVIQVKQGAVWLKARIIETEAYYLEDKASHASLGYTDKRKALFMPAGTIYMYYSRGGGSLNISCSGPGNAVLIKSAYPYLDPEKDEMASRALQCMQRLNPTHKGEIRPITKLCAGQVLLCKSLGLTVAEWDAKAFDPKRFYFTDVGYQPTHIIQARRLGISVGRDEHLFYRFIDKSFAEYATSNPLRKKNYQLQQDYFIWSGVALKDCHAARGLPSRNDNTP